MKECSKCKIVKDYTEFNKAKYHSTGYTSNCKVCIKITADAWRKSEHGQQVKRQNRKTEASIAAEDKRTAKRKAVIKEKRDAKLDIKKEFEKTATWENTENNLRECIRCKETKILKEFHRKHNKIGYYTAACKKCVANSQKEYRQTIKYKQIRKIRRTLPLYKEIDRKHRQSEKYKITQKTFLKSPEQMEKSRIRAKRARDASILLRIKSNLRSRINKIISNKGFSKKGNLNSSLGCSGAFLIEYLEKQFLPGMSWDFRSDIHIDHIIPLATAKTIEDVYKLNHYTNLRPMWAIDNLKKGSKILKETV